jgi:hypothetical protein
MFELMRRDAKLLNFNARAEKHGTEPVTAGDLKLQINMASADLLPMFSPELRSLLYCKRDDVEQDLADQVHDLPNLRLPKLVTPIKWKSEIVGATFTLYRGVTNIELEGCVVKRFEINPMEGGTAILTFTVQGHPNEQQCGTLCSLIDHTIEISVEPPEGGGEREESDED